MSPTQASFGVWDAGAKLRLRRSVIGAVCSPSAMVVLLKRCFWRPWRPSWAITRVNRGGDAGLDRQSDAGLQKLSGWVDGQGMGASLEEGRGTSLAR